MVDGNFINEIFWFNFFISHFNLLSCTCYVFATSNLLVLGIFEYLKHRLKYIVGPYSLLR
jgi:hypothetical protein